MTTQKAQVIEAIKNLDFDKLHDLLDDHRSYAEVSKSRFIKNFKYYLENVCNPTPFDIFFGVCQSCRKGCEVITLLCKKNGYYLDMIIDGEDEVEDITICRNATNFISLNKLYPISFSVYDDDKVTFEPSDNYFFYTKIYAKIKREIDKLGSVKKVADIFTIKDRNPIFFEPYSEEVEVELLYTRLRIKISRLKELFENLIPLKDEAHRAIRELDQFSEVKSDYDRLEWYVKNRDVAEYALFLCHFDLEGPTPSILEYYITKKSISLDISGYELVLKYFKLSLDLEEYFYTKYDVESVYPNEKGKEYTSLMDYFRDYNLYPELVEKYGEKKM